MHSKCSLFNTEILCRNVARTNCFAPRSKTIFRVATPALILYCMHQKGTFPFFPTSKQFFVGPRGGNKAPEWLNQGANPCETQYLSVKLNWKIRDIQQFLFVIHLNVYNVAWRANKTSNKTGSLSTWRTFLCTTFEKQETEWKAGFLSSFLPWFNPNLF